MCVPNILSRRDFGPGRHRMPSTLAAVGVALPERPSPKLAPAYYHPVGGSPKWKTPTNAHVVESPIRVRFVRLHHHNVDSSAYAVVAKRGAAETHAAIICVSRALRYRTFTRSAILTTASGGKGAP